jgi:predicted DNA-binding protein
VSNKKKKARADNEGERPILAVRIPHDIKRVLETLKTQTGRKFQPSQFVNEAIVEKLEREYNTKWLVENGYIMPDGARRNETT